MEPGQIITKADIAELHRWSDYSRLDNPTVIQAFGVMRELQAWVEQTTGGMTPTPHLAICNSSLSVQISDVEVWNTETHSFDELTFAACRAEFEKYVADLQAVITPDAE